MASIKLTELRPAGSELFNDSESFLNELNDQDMSTLLTSGGGSSSGGWSLNSFSTGGTVSTGISTGGSWSTGGSFSSGLNSFSSSSY
jgi:hypothetical protein